MPLLDTCEHRRLHIQHTAYSIQYTKTEHPTRLQPTPSDYSTMQSTTSIYKKAFHHHRRCRRHRHRDFATQLLVKQITQNTAQRLVDQPTRESKAKQSKAKKKKDGRKEEVEREGSRTKKALHQQHPRNQPIKAKPHIPLPAKPHIPLP
jgi:hypothetical protein